MEFVRFRKLHNYIHSYEIKGLDEFLRTYEEEFNLIYYKFEKLRDRGIKGFNDSILNPNIVKPLREIQESIVDKFYIVDKNWEDYSFMLYSQTESDNKKVYHNHQKSFSIASTMYLNAPNREDGGELQFFFGEQDEPIIHPIKDTIYFFPGWSLHRPLAHKGKNIRHCINWGYQCSNNPIHKLTGDRW
tara:strand:+ start:812 stop:1375 length:564 start_codon:yes stop_codon:yes gene_type:complete